MFYSNYVKLCNSVGKTPSAVALEIGIEKSTVTRWKQGKSQTDANIQKVADYFGVTPEYLLTEHDEQKEKPTGNADELTNEEMKFIEWFRNEASEKDKALVRMIVDGGDK